MPIIKPHLQAFCKYLFFHRYDALTRIVNNTGSSLIRHSSTNVDNDVIDKIFPEVEGTPSTVPPNYLKFRGKKAKKTVEARESPPKEVDKSKHVIIACKQSSLNHYVNQRYDKLDSIPLASKGWLHPKSKGDFFKIDIYPDKDKRESVFWVDGHSTYDNLGLDSAIIGTLNKLGFTRPTNIQVNGIPVVLRNQNTLLAGETGSGKTLAFLLPLVQQILQWRALTPERKFNSPLAMVLVPGRELAYQIADVADQLAKELMFDLDVVVGGHTRRLITHPNFRPVDLFICTTGAASKLTTSGIYNMSFVRHLVLDEADTILDDSFNDLIVRYLKKFPISYGRWRGRPDTLPEFCKLTLASATIPTSVATILEGIIDPESLVKVETPRLHQVMCNVPQYFFRTRQSEKPTKLLEVAKKSLAKKMPLIIFSNRNKVCDWISMFLNENSVPCVNINGDMHVDIRSGRFDQFQRGFVDVVSCTDMASRGLDTIRAKMVLNYDFPLHISDYIHRCGRVGRVGHTDNCFITNFVAGPLEVELVKKIETSVRTMSVLPNVNANITRVLHHKIMKQDSLLRNKN